MEKKRAPLESPIKITQNNGRKKRVVDVRPWKIATGGRKKAPGRKKHEDKRVFPKKVGVEAGEKKLKWKDTETGRSNAEWEV